MGKLSRSWSLASSSWGVLRDDKELLALPAISAVASLIGAAPFFAGAFLTTSTTGTGSDQGLQIGPLGYALMFLGYLVSAYVTIFFQAALIHAANERLEGGDPTLGSALAGAGERATKILPWALLSATVSVILRSIQERSGLLGRIVIGLVGMAWTLVTFLVLPMIVIEGAGLKDALSRSVASFKGTWGENVVGNAGIGIVSVLAVLAGVGLLGPLAVVGFMNDLVVLAIGAIVLLVVWVVVVSVFSAALTGVFQTALYRYAVHGEASPGFDAAQIQGAFAPKSGLTGRRSF